MRLLKRSLIVLIAFLFITYIPSYASSDLIDINKGATYTSDDLYELSKQLVNTYPDILHLEIIGYSVDSKPIYAIVMTDNIKEEINREDFNVSNFHFYVEAGMHAREIANPVNVLKMIETYAKDYYDDSVIKEFNLKDELKDSAIHFIPLVNPDGFDLVKFGRDSVKTSKALSILDSIKDKNYTSWKANISGVDINMNFPDEYYDATMKQWVNKFRKYPSKFYSAVPSSEFYGGPYGGSEPETQAIMNYILKYDFRNFLSLHSMGKYVDCGKYWFSKEYNRRNLELGHIVNKYNGYKIVTSSSGKGGGFLSDFVAARTHKPIVTVETTAVLTPTPQEYYQEAYNDTYLLPLYFVRHGRNVGYFKYRLYVDNVYVRDYYDKNYAYANAERLDGEIVEGEGRPSHYLYKPITRAEFLAMIIKKYFNDVNLFVNPLLAVPKDIHFLLFDSFGKVNVFKDDLSMYPNFARFIGILSSNEDNFRPNDPITTYEATKIIYNTHKVLDMIDFDVIGLDIELPAVCPGWAVDGVKYVLYKKYVDVNFFNDKYLLYDKNDYILNNLFSEDFISCID